jgi:hypothetical protein
VVIWKKPAGYSWQGKIEGEEAGEQQEVKQEVKGAGAGALAAASSGGGSYRQGGAPGKSLPAASRGVAVKQEEPQAVKEEPQEVGGGGGGPAATVVSRPLRPGSARSTGTLVVQPAAEGSPPAGVAWQR